MKPIRLLIVEDEFIVASDLEARLCHLGYEIAGKADTGPAAIESAAATSPDLVLMDIRLKGEMDGIAAAKQIRSKLRLPVVFLTAYADDSTLQRAKAAEPYGYILKPFEDRELRTIIEIALYKHETEREIQRSNRLYAALSQINETIIRTTSREELFEKVCLISCETAGFKLAWVGWLDRATQAVVPVSRSGRGAGYLDHVQIYADDRPEGRGPVGDCIRTGEISVCNDFLNDARSAPWRDHLQTFGLRAAAALPLRFRGEIRGALVIYGDEADVFRNKEVALLHEAAADISFALDHLEQEERMRESEAKWRSYMENAPVGILVADASGQHVECNRAVEEMLGYSHEELLKTHAKDIPACPTDAAVAKHFAEIMRSGRSEGEFQLRRKNGELLWASIRALRLDGERLMGVFQDITGHRELEMELRQAQKMEAVAHLAGGVAHDFNNILAAMLMQLSLLRMRPNLDEGTRRAIDELDRAAGRGSDIIRQLLLFSRRSVISVKPLNLQNILEALIKMLRRLIGENIHLQLETNTPPSWVEADAGMMEQVVMNLVVNARDAMSGGGEINIAIHNTNFEATGVRDNPNRRLGPFICLSVSDTGSGMDAATRKRIFEPFFTTKEAGKGTGLGLATVHGIVAQHRGWLEVESEIAVGTTFHVYLPACPAPPVESVEASPAQPIPRGSEDVFLVEDDPDVRRAVRQTLLALGYRVHEAADGPEALKLLQTQDLPVKLLITDMVMPNGISGLELVERVRVLKPDLQAIVVSGYSEEILKIGSLAKSGIVFLSKPFPIAVLAKAIRQSLDDKA
ncbi:MAG: response regulator [Limisphaerales bacterium]